MSCGPVLRLARAASPKHPLRTLQRTPRSGVYPASVMALESATFCDGGAGRVMRTRAFSRARFSTCRVAQRVCGTAAPCSATGPWLLQHARRTVHMCVVVQCGSGDSEALPDVDTSTVFTVFGLFVTHREHRNVRSSLTPMSCHSVCSEPSFDIDLAALKLQYHTLQRQFHPDLFGQFDAVRAICGALLLFFFFPPQTLLTRAALCVFSKPSKSPLTWPQL